jgi:6-phosphogluconolactonase
MQIHKETDPSSLSQHAAQWIISQMERKLLTQDRFTWVLSGGNTPKMLYTLMASPAYRHKIPWGKLHLFWGDERDVPFEDPGNNGRMAYDAMIANVPIPAEQVHYIRTDVSPQQSATDYDRVLQSYFGEQGNTFDLVLLGMGDNGHTLSLFPGQPVVHEKKAWTFAYWLESQKMYRITMTAPVVNRASQIAFLVTGKDKTAVLHEVLYGPYNPDVYPAQIIKPVSGELHWFVDKEAIYE